MTNSKMKCIHSTGEGERTGTGATSCGAPSGRWLSSSMQMLSWSSRHVGPGILTCCIVFGKAIHHYRTAQRDWMRKHHGKDQAQSIFSNTSMGNGDAAIVGFQDDGKRLTSAQLRQKYKEARKKSETGVHKVLISWWLHVRTCPIRGRTCRSCPGLCDMRHLLTSTRTFARSHILLRRHPRGSARVDAAAEYSCQLVTRSLGPRTVSACSCCPAYNPTHIPLCRSDLRSLMSNITIILFNRYLKLQHTDCGA